MKKYFCIYKSELMTSMQYILNILFRIVNYVVILFIYVNLWNYIYDDANQLINGYSKNQMIWYVIFTEVIWTGLETRKLCKKISNDVKGGNIAYIMNKPYSYIGYAISGHLGACTLKIIFGVITGLSLGLIFLNEFPTITFAGILIVIFSAFLAIVINLLLLTFIGLLSFIIEDSNPIYWLYSKMILILGVLFPIEYFPGMLGKIMKFSPIYVTCYGPAKLFVDFSYGAIAEILIYQIIYVIIAFVLCYAMYMKGVKKLNVTGG